MNTFKLSKKRMKQLEEEFKKDWRFPSSKNKCEKCGHSWFSRKENEAPKSCPQCKRYDWNKKAEEKLKVGK